MTSSFFVQCLVKTIIRLCFCDIQNNQGVGKSRLRLITVTSTLIILDITKTSSNNWFYYTLVSQARFRLAISTQLILACSVSLTSYLQTVNFVYVKVMSYLQTIVLCMQK